VALPRTVADVNAALLGKQIVGGLDLARWYPELGESAALWCATELTTKAQMDAAEEGVSR